MVTRIVQRPIVKCLVKEQRCVTGARDHPVHERPVRTGCGDGRIEYRIHQQRGAKGKRHQHGKDPAPLLTPDTLYEKERCWTNDPEPEEKSQRPGRDNTSEKRESALVLGVEERPDEGQGVMAEELG